jgi:hypothetical protein
MKFIGRLKIDDETYPIIYKGKKGYFYSKTVWIDLYGDLSSHIKEMQVILSEHPDAVLDRDSRPWDDELSTVVKYDVYIPSTDPQLKKLLEESKKLEKERKEKDKLRDVKILEELKKRSPELFK